LLSFPSKYIAPTCPPCPILTYREDGKILFIGTSGARPWMSDQNCSSVPCQTTPFLGGHSPTSKFKPQRARVKLLQNACIDTVDAYPLPCPYTHNALGNEPRCLQHRGQFRQYVSFRSVLDFGCSNRRNFDIRVFDGAFKLNCFNVHGPNSMRISSS